MSDTHASAAEILMNNMMTTDEMVAWAILTVQFAKCEKFQRFKNDDPNTPPPTNDLNIELAYAILRTYATHYNAKTLISDKGKPATDKYVESLLNNALNK